MPVSTRKVTYAAGTQPGSMVAGGQGPDPADAHQNENQPKNELQEDKTPSKPMPGPRTPSPSAHAVAAALADVEIELESAKKTASELRKRLKSRQLHVAGGVNIVCTPPSRTGQAAWRVCWTVDMCQTGDDCLRRCPQSRGRASS